MNAKKNSLIAQAKALLWDFIQYMRGDRKKFIKELKKDPDISYAKLAALYVVLGHVDDILKLEEERKDE